MGSHKAWRRWVPLAIGALTAPVAAMSVGVAPAGAEPVTTGTDHYVSFGDSFVSGPGMQPQRPGTCARSEKNFPSLVATRLGVAEFTDASCSGATLNHLWNTQGTNPPQLNALTADTTLVTFGTLGGNDLGLVPLAVECFTSTCSGSPGDARHQAVDALKPKILQGLADTAARAPQADIVVVGYSHYIPATSCSAIAGITPSEAVYFQGLVDHLTDVLKSAADESGVAFADMNAIPGVKDHTVCAAPEHQWVRGMNTYNDGVRLHPSTCGMAAYGQQVTRAIQQHRGQPVDTFVDPCPVPPVVTPPPPPPPPGPGPDPVPPPGPDPDAEALAALNRAAASVRFRQSCSHRTVHFVVRRGHGKITRVVFRVGTKRIGQDTRAPWRIKRKAHRIARHRGKVGVRVVLQHDGHRVVRTIWRKRPGCMR